MIELSTLCYIRNEHQTLMLLRNKKQNDVHEGKWNGLGGKFLPGESPEECAIREIREESGLNATKLRLHGTIIFPEFEKDTECLVYLFTVSEFSGTLIDSPEGTLEWIDNHKVSSLNLWEGDKIFLPWLDRKDFFSAKFVYENGQYISHSVCFYS